MNQNIIEYLNEGRQWARVKIIGVDAMRHYEPNAPVPIGREAEYWALVAEYLGKYCTKEQFANANVASDIKQNVLKHWI